MKEYLWEATISAKNMLGQVQQQRLTFAIAKDAIEATKKVQNWMENYYGADDPSYISGLNIKERVDIQ